MYMRRNRIDPTLSDVRSPVPEVQRQEWSRDCQGRAFIGRASKVASVRRCLASRGMVNFPVFAGWRRDTVASRGQHDLVKLSRDADHSREFLGIIIAAIDPLLCPRRRPIPPSRGQRGCSGFCAPGSLDRSADFWTDLSISDFPPHLGAPISGWPFRTISGGFEAATLGGRAKQRGAGQAGSERWR